MPKREEPLRLTLVEVAYKGAREVVRIEVLQVVHALTHANLQHRKLKLVAHGKRDAAVPSSLVTTMPSRESVLLNSRACCKPFWPVVASMTSTV